ncbi:sulfurtransferase, partial [Bordetella petrii]|uniref:sulfurtransferase n=1 Tax=Bordetella petrii TaxID=94624 RepID=UPI0022A6E8FF
AGLPLAGGSSPAVSRGGGAALLREPLVQVVLHDAVRANLASGRLLVIDARAPDRYRGENETLDPVGGHIPGARNRLFRDNLDESGRFKAPAELRQAFEALAGGHAPTQLVSQCGSGVTACHNLLALELAGLPGAALYPGSWSEWCSQPGAPIATGPNP